MSIKLFSPLTFYPLNLCYKQLLLIHPFLLLLNPKKSQNESWIFEKKLFINALSYHSQPFIHIEYKLLLACFYWHDVKYINNIYWCYLILYWNKNSGSKHCFFWYFKVSKQALELLLIYLVYPIFILFMLFIDFFRCVDIVIYLGLKFVNITDWALYMIA